MKGVVANTTGAIARRANARPWSRVAALMTVELPTSAAPVTVRALGDLVSARGTVRA